MNARSHPFLVLLTAVTLAAGHGAQEKPAPDLDAGQAASVQRSAHGAAWVGDELWAAGADYKALFRDGGFELHPALGRRAPRNLPLAFELESIERGGALVHAPDGPATPELGADGVVRYARGDAIVERYEPRADGLEQSFVFAAPLPGSGDLVVRGRIASELAAPLGEHAELELTVPGLGGVRIGAVTGIDALGRTAAGSLRYDGATLELVLPAAFVDAAAYPLVLDPLIGAAFIVPGDGIYDEEDPDACYSVGADLYLVAWHREYSAIDFDIHAQRISPSGALVGGIVFVENASGTIAINPTVAHVLASRRFLVAWQERTTASYDVKARAVNAYDGVLSSPLTLAALAEDEIDPDVCGERTTVDDDAIVVWERQDVGLFGAQVSLPIVGEPFVVGAPIQVAADPRAYRPAIAKSFGDAGRAVVAYNVLYSAVDVDVHVTLIDRNGTVLDGPKPVAATGAMEAEPDVDGDGTSWMLAYVYSPGGGADGEIECLTLKVQGSATLQPLASNQLTNDAVGQYVPAVAWTPGKTFVAWQEQYDLFDTDIYVMGVDPLDCSWCETTAALDISTTWDGEPELASQYSGGGSGDQLLATWYSGDSALFSVDATDVKAFFLEAFGASGSAVNLGGGCGSGGSISTSGSIAAGNPNFAVQLTGADPLATLGLLVLSPPGATLGCGPCTVILPGTQFPVTVSGGAASVTLPIPCDAVILGAQLDAQWAVLPTASVACPLFGNVGASPRLRMTIGQ